MVCLNIVLQSGKETVSIYFFPTDGEYGNYFEGDMIITEEQKEALFARTRNGLIATKYRWANKTVPYRLTSDHTQEQRNYIEKALRTLESVSCLTFVQHTNEKDYVQLQVCSHFYKLQFFSKLIYILKQN